MCLRLRIGGVIAMGAENGISLAHVERFGQRNRPTPRRRPNNVRSALVGQKNRPDRARGERVAGHASHNQPRRSDVLGLRGGWTKVGRTIKTRGALEYLSISI